MSQAKLQTFDDNSTENAEIAAGDTITVSYERAWNNPPAHWDDNPTKTLAVESVSRSGVIKSVPDNGQYFRIYPDGDVYAQPVDSRTVTIRHGKNATVQLAED